MKYIRTTVVIVVVILTTVLMYMYSTHNQPPRADEPTEVTAVTILEETTIAETTEPLNDEPVLFSEVKYETPVTYWGAVDHKDALEWYIIILEEEIASGEYTDRAVEIMNDEISRLELDMMLLQVHIDEFARWREEYPVAAEVWFYLRGRGYSEEVCAGIIGNMMIETAGGTMNLVAEIYDPPRAFYGLCQWSLYYYPEARDMSIWEQLELLTDTIEREFINFGFCYYTGFTYDAFHSLGTPEEAALAFAKVYERCDSGTYGARQRCARIAYNYFRSEE